MNQKQFFAFVFFLTFCSFPLHADTNPTLAAELKDASGASVGKVVIEFQKDGPVKLFLNADHLTPGEHAFHIHDVGQCDAPDFKSAGPHFNPGQKQHGVNNPNGPHAGDLPNITVSADGVAVLETTLESSVITESVLLDGDGAAVVIHEKADDNVTDPAGNAGSRIACGVITK